VNSLSVGIVLGTPLAYAALWRVDRRAGRVINLGVEGIDADGAVVGFIVTINTHSAVAGFAAAVAAGAALASLHA